MLIPNAKAKTKTIRQLYFVFDPICLRSGFLSKVEKGGGSYWPSKLPLELVSVE